MCGCRLLIVHMKYPPRYIEKDYLMCRVNLCDWDVCVSGSAADHNLQRVHSGSNHGDREEEVA